MEGNMKAVQAFALALCLFIGAGSGLAGDNPIQNFPGDFMDWGDMAITVIATGVPNDSLSPAQYRISAVKDARADAEVKLLSVLKQLNYSSNKVVADVLSKSPKAANRIAREIKDYKILGHPRQLPDGVTEIDVQLPITGNILRELINASEDLPSPLTAIPAIKDTSREFTGIIIDCRGLDIEFALAPQILSEGGEAVYSLRQTDTALAIAGGIVQYADSIEQGNARAGSRPITIKALRLSGMNNCDVVIDEVSSAVIKADEIRGILKNCQVVFLVD
jgi:hypothetical protein